MENFDACEFMNRQLFQVFAMQVPNFSNCILCFEAEMSHAF